MTDLDEDPYLIKSWEEYYNMCLKAGKLDIFKSALSKYIYETNNHMQKSIDAHVSKLIEELIHEKTEEARKENMKSIEKAKKKRLSQFKYLS